MSTTTETTPSDLFDAGIYDLEGTPALNGRKAHVVVLRFDATKLDRTSLDDMLLAGRLELNDEPLSLSVRATVTERTWAESPEEVRVVYRLEIGDVSV